MKLHYSKILLFVLPLNMLEHTKNKPSITPHHTGTPTLRVLSEYGTQSSNYDKDADMKSVKEQFYDRTSQRFEEYEERMKEKRQKRKEERDKNIQKIIEEDKREKSLAKKVEKGCLRCGCGLGGGILPVWGLVSGLWYASLSQYATKLAIQKGVEAGIKEGLVQIKNIYGTTSYSANVPNFTVADMLSSGKFNNGVNMFDMVQHINTMSNKFGESMYTQFFSKIDGMVRVEGMDKFNVQNGERIVAVTEAFEKAKAAEFTAKTGLLSNTIIASVVTIIIIVLIMVIIYLVLRYRRKKKMKKKAQYTKLLNQ
ncbi:PIR protein [Plasmodium reichenowi]|uniref:PIR protein n=1 Tax=Plasmodium reichenowi TaxID=5854 RepID=A0A2P9DRZ0_PLARE|nr:PIR protein [Plasmodium reichenowi]